MIRILYFAHVREQLGRPGEELPAAPGLTTAADIQALLSARGGIWTEVLGSDQGVLVAVNQVLARPEAVIADGDEVAFFPPVTGG